MGASSPEPSPRKRPRVTGSVHPPARVGWDKTCVSDFYSYHWFIGYVDNSIWLSI